MQARAPPRHASFEFSSLGSGMIIAGCGDAATRSRSRSILMTELTASLCDPGEIDH